jgi:uncharacterized membrane protein
MNEQRIRRIFEVSVLLKGAHALIECIGGLALALASTTSIEGWVNRLTQEELIEDPNDFIATHFLRLAEGLSVNTKSFYAFYLLSHGIVKLALVAGLLRNKLWAYPTSLAVLALFIIYQIYRFLLHAVRGTDCADGVRRNRHVPYLARIWPYAPPSSFSHAENRRLKGSPHTDGADRWPGQKILPCFKNQDFQEFDVMRFPLTTEAQPI